MHLGLGSGGTAEPAKWLSEEVEWDGGIFLFYVEEEILKVRRYLASGGRMVA